MGHRTLLAQQAELVNALFGTPGASPETGAASATQHADATELPLKTVIADNAYLSSDRGLKAYQSNGRMLAERVLVAAYPVVTAIVSAESMGQLARALWHAHPPQRGDLAHWGQALPGFIAASPQLATLPWLADVARVEWALHTASFAADAPPADLPSLALLGTHDPDHLTLALASATTVLRLDWTATRIVLAHRPELGTPAPPTPATAHGVAEPIAEGVTDQIAHRVAALGTEWATPTGEWVSVWRPGWRALALAVSAAEAAFVSRLLAKDSLLAALECEAAQGLDFGAWLPQAISDGRVQGVAVMPPL
jgi:hypothetical protein